MSLLPQSQKLSGAMEGRVIEPQALTQPPTLHEWFCPPGCRSSGQNHSRPPLEVEGLEEPTDGSGHAYRGREMYVGLGGGADSSGRRDHLPPPHPPAFLRPMQTPRNGSERGFPPCSACAEWAPQRCDVPASPARRGRPLRLPRPGGARPRAQRRPGWADAVMLGVGVTRPFFSPPPATHAGGRGGISVCDPAPPSTSPHNTGSPLTCRSCFPPALRDGAPQGAAPALAR